MPSARMTRDFGEKGTGGLSFGSTDGAGPRPGGPRAPIGGRPHAGAWGAPRRTPRDEHEARPGSACRQVGRAGGRSGGTHSLGVPLRRRDMDMYNSFNVGSPYDGAKLRWGRFSQADCTLSRRFRLAGRRGQSKMRGRSPGEALDSRRPRVEPGRMYETLTLQREGHLTWLTLDRPGSL